MSRPNLKKLFVGEQLDIVLRRPKDLIVMTRKYKDELTKLRIEEVLEKHKNANEAEKEDFFAHNLRCYQLEKEGTEPRLIHEQTMPALTGDYIDPRLSYLISRPKEFREAEIVSEAWGVNFVREGDLVISRLLGFDRNGNFFTVKYSQDGFTEIVIFGDGLQTEPKIDGFTDFRGFVNLDQENVLIGSSSMIIGFPGPASVPATGLWIFNTKTGEKFIFESGRPNIVKITDLQNESYLVQTDQIIFRLIFKDYKRKKMEMHPLTISPNKNWFDAAPPYYDHETNTIWFIDKEILGFFDFRKWHVVKRETFEELRGDRGVEITGAFGKLYLNKTDRYKSHMFEVDAKELAKAIRKLG
ncbi:MAG: hypothetical protein AABX38_01360 [Candidatus Micrarchaeota archaeon]